MDTDTHNLHRLRKYVNMESTKRLTAREKEILKQAGQILNRVRMAKTTPESRKAISEKARLAGLEVRRANAARRKAEKEGKE